MGRPKGDGETPKRNVRIKESLWQDAKKEAKKEDRTITDVIVSSLTKYVAERRAQRRAQRVIPLSDDTATLLRHLTADQPNGFVFRPRSVQLRTFHAANSQVVLLDSSEVSRMLRALSASYRAPLHRGVAQDLEELADALDVQALAAQEAARGDGFV
ncbi:MULTISPECIES: hypothetical protein [Streptomyces]|uniref:Uncharacterized protein n=1 Tax=Streptomyces caatingaensis TaxID=1678637 RepID=A0A0K9XJA3_9ACTN|nr:hypothetical protein [Streptomyces caatingaensis]KNB53450.1 hypothetical protein AC230_01900 [Streptomyces caatingaensis]